MPLSELLPLFETPECRVHYLHGGDDVWVLFGAVGSRTPTGVETMKRLGVSAFFISPKRDDWYQSFDPLNLWLILRGFPGLKIGFGVSMGGFAALVFADRLGLDRVLACSPQVIIDSAVTPDQRWSLEWEGLKSEGKLHQPDASGVQTPAFVFIDTEDEMDVWHASRLGHNARIINMPYGSHAIATEMVTRGVWGAVVAAVHAGDGLAIDAAVKAFKAGRKGSYVRVVELARKAAQKHRFRLAERLFRRAIEINPQKHHAYHFLSVMFEQEGRKELALEASRDAITHFNISDGPMAGLFETLAHRYAEMGNMDSAEEAFLNGFSQAPDVDSLRVKYERFLDATGRTARHAAE